MLQAQIRLHRLCWTLGPPPGYPPVAVSTRILPTWHCSMVSRTGTSLLLWPLSTTVRPVRQDEGACGRVRVERDRCRGRLAEGSERVSGATRDWHTFPDPAACGPLTD